VIHFVHSNDMKDMGGLRKLMPVTHIAFLIACLAIAGVPPFAGFFSKEEILLASFQSNKAVYIIGLFTAGLTAFYMFRLYFSIFWRKEAVLHEAHHADGTASMKWPLIVLSVCSIAAGFVPFTQWVTSDGAPLSTHFDWTFSLIPVALVVVAILIAARLYKTENEAPVRLATALGGLYKAAYRKFYIDEIYLFITQKVIFNLIGRPAAWVDRYIIDGMMNGLAYVTANTSNMIKVVQSGKVQNYALYFFGGIVGLAIVFIYLWK
jgi:NADH-quinone oxidoreductase subunit L